MGKVKLVIKLCLFFIICLVDFALGDAIIDYQFFPRGKVVLYITGTKSRIDISDFDTPHITLIYHKQPRTLFIISHKDKLYSKIDDTTLKKAKSLKKQYEEQLALLPPHMREFIKQTLNVPGFRRFDEEELCSHPKIVRTDKFWNLKAIVVDGCKHFDPLKNTLITCWFWFVEGKHFNLSMEDLMTVISFMEFEDELMKTIGLPIGAEITSFLITKPQRELKLEFEIPFPVKGVAVSAEKEEVQLVLKSLHTKPLNKLLFEIPTGYKEVKIPLP